MQAVTSTIRTDRPFTRRLSIDAPADHVFDAIATLDGLRAWWTPLVDGSTAEGDDVRLEFEGLDQHIIMHVDAARRPSEVRWTCVIHTALPEWQGTEVRWSIHDRGAGACELALTHVGLTPELECFDHCEVGWDRFLESIVGYVERGKGAPYRDDGTGTCSTRRPRT